MRMKRLKFGDFVCFMIVVLVIILMGTALFTSCAGFSKTPTAASPCLELEPGESRICDVIPNPQDVDFMLRLANAAALEKDVYQAAAALKTIDSLIEVVEHGVSYGTLYRMLVEDTSPLIFTVVSEYSGHFYGVNTLITPKDVGFIVYHLKKQRQLVMMAMATSDRSRKLSTSLFAMSTEIVEKSCGGIDGREILDETECRSIIRGKEVG